MFFLLYLCSMKLSEDFKTQVSRLLSEDEAERLLHSICCEDTIVSVRFNDAKGYSVPSSLERIPWCDKGAYLTGRPQFTFDPHFHAGSYYVQDASSMFIYHVIKSLVKRPVKYLDLCAAPGGKTTAALQALPKGSVVVANEIVPQRAQILRENVIKWGADNCMVTNDSPKSFGNLAEEFDVIAADVPCSGEGMFRKDAEAVAQWSPALVEQCAIRQRGIISDVWPALKPGGLLIYSTCTYNADENELMAKYIASELGATIVEVPVEESWNIRGSVIPSCPSYRFMPHLTRGEGLYMCILRKNAETSVRHRLSDKKSKSSKRNLGSTKIPAQVLSWLGDNYGFVVDDNVIKAVQRDLKEMLQSYNNILRVIKELGIEVCTIKGKNFIPSHELAMLPSLVDGSFPECDVDYATAISYLRGESITIEAPRGYVLITWKGARLGFVNNLGNRANNLYPKPWRILSSHQPDNIPLVIEASSSC